MLTRSLLASLALCLAPAAQVTSPAGYVSVEGNTTFNHFTGSRRFQQLDYTHAGGPLTVASIAWRRNGNVTQNAPARSFDFQVDMGRADFGFISQRFDDNYLPGTRTTVFGPLTVNFPDWSANMGSPGPFDFQVALTTPFVYPGVDALVIDFVHTNNTSNSGVSVDRAYSGQITPPAGTALGTGCTVTGGSAPFAHTAYMANYGAAPVPQYGMRFRTGGSNAVPSSPVTLMIDAQNANLPGFLCSTLYALPTITLPLAADASGRVPEINLAIPHNPFLGGATLYSQLLTIDVGQTIPVAVSNGRQTTMPATAVNNVIPCSYGWNSLPNDLVLTAHFIGGGVVMLLQ